MQLRPRKQVNLAAEPGDEAGAQGDDSETEEEYRLQIATGEDIDEDNDDDDLEAEPEAPTGVRRTGQGRGEKFLAAVSSQSA